MGAIIQTILKRNSLPLQAISTDIPPSVYPARIEGVFFDVYGTLFISSSGDIGVSVDTGPGQDFHQALQQSGFLSATEDTGAKAKELFFSSIEAEHRRARKRGIEYPEVDILVIWEKVLHLLSEQGDLTDRYNHDRIMEVAAWYESLVNRVFPMPGAEEILSFFKSRTIPVGLVSNAQFYTPLLFPALLDRSLEELGIAEKLCVWSYKEREAKPSVKLFQTALQRLSLSHPSILPENLLYVGNDMLNDIKAAGDAGFKTVLFAGDTRSCRTREEDPRCKGCSPDFIINDLQQLEKICYIEAVQ